MLFCSLWEERGGRDETRGAVPHVDRRGIRVDPPEGDRLLGLLGADFTAQHDEVLHANHGLQTPENARKIGSFQEHTHAHTRTRKRAPFYGTPLSNSRQNKNWIAIQRDVIT